jgi:hypothetical protein
MKYMKNSVFCALGWVLVSVKTALKPPGLGVKFWQKE